MAETIWFSDGSHEVILHPDTPQRDFQRIVRDRLGPDSETLFLRILSSCDNREFIDDPALLESDEEDWERIADGYLMMLHSTVDELAAVLDRFSAPRLDRRKLERDLQRIQRNLYKNL